MEKRFAEKTKELTEDLGSERAISVSLRNTLDAKDERIH
jgi:hypothetical protein